MELCKYMKYFKCTLLAILIFACYVEINTKEINPEEIALEYFEVLATEGVTSTVKFIHPDELAEIKEMILSGIRHSNAEGICDYIRSTLGEHLTIVDLETVVPSDFYRLFYKLDNLENENFGLNVDKINVIGSINEGNKRHVLSRVTFEQDGYEVIEIKVLSFIPFEDSWKLQVDEKFKTMARITKSALVNN